MTVGELIEKLRELPSEAPIVYYHGFAYEGGFVVIDEIETEPLTLDGDGEYQFAKGGEAYSVLCVRLG